MTEPRIAQLQVTGAGEWKRGEIVQLPSGKVARLKKPDAISMIVENGKIPDALSPLIFGKETQKAVKEGRNPDVDMTPETLVALMPILDKLTKACFLEPRVVDEPGEDELAPSDVEYRDKMFLFNWMFGEQGQAAARFRPEQKSSLDALPRQRANGDAPVQPVGVES